MLDGLMMQVFLFLISNGQLETKMRHFYPRFCTQANGLPQLTIG